MTRRFPLLIGLLFCFIQVQAGDLLREMDFAGNIQRSHPIGQIIWLEAGQQRFLGLFTESEKTDNAAAVVILHDHGAHPDQLPLIHALRIVLPNHNWTTLSIQLPLREIGAGAADYDALFDDANARIQAAIAYLRQHGGKYIALIGYGTGAEMALYSLSQDANDLLALIAISLPLPDSGQRYARISDFIPKITLPFLDLFAEFDLPDVVDTARRRRMLAKDNPVYRQLEIYGDNHAYQHDHGMVIKRIYSWLDLTLSQN